MLVARFLSSVVAVICLSTFTHADDKIDHADAMERIQQLGGQFLDARPVALSVQLEPIPFVVIPFWAIVIPLTLLAAYLLLSRPKPRLVPVKAAARAKSS